MMTRKEIKARAKAIIKQNYTASVVPFLLVIIATTAICFVTCMLGVPFMIPLSSVSVYLIYCMLWYGKAPVPQTPFIATFNQGYLRKLGGMLWMGLFSALWSMLFIIPGIVKMYAYSMTPHILAVYTNVPATDALKLSMKLTKGKKLQLFVLDLSFIGWTFLGGLTSNILTVLFVAPYKGITYAGTYEEIIREALENGTVTREELGLAPVPELTDETA